MKSKSADVANKTTEIIEATREVASIVPRALRDMPELVHNGAKEIALLTVVARQQAFEFAPVMQSLEALASLKDWSHDFLIAHDLKSERSFGVSFDWRKAPMRRYQSFQDFYRRELEPTWGNWENLQRVYARVVSGEITEQQGKSELFKKINEEDQANKEQSKQGRRTDLVYNNESDVHEVERPSGNTRAAAIRRLREHRPDIHARVLAGELSPHAGMIEAEFRKKSQRKKLSRVEREQRRIEKMTKAERLAIWKWLAKEFQ